MTMIAYLTIRGQKQGDLRGSVTQRGHESSILVHAYSHEVDSPRDPASGLPTGKRMHKPLVIVKDTDLSSPPLWTALTTSENLTLVELKLWAPGSAPSAGAGLEQQIYTIQLTNANIASMREMMPDNQSPATTGLSVREEVTLTYQKIQWTWADGGLTASDDWESTV